MAQMTVRRGRQLWSPPAQMKVCAPALPAALIALLTLHAAAGAAAAPEQSNAMGVVNGSVKLTAAATAPLAASPYGRRGVPPKRSLTTPDIRNVIVYVSGRKPAATPAPVHARIVQRDEGFMPQVTAITVGSTVEFPNDDPFFHNVFSLSKAKAFDLGRYPSGTSKAQTFDKTGIVKVFCHLHSQMTALIMILDHPWFTTPTDDGAFNLPPVPAGEHTVVAWHERIGERRERVRVAAGDTVKVSFTLPVLETTP